MALQTRDVHPMLVYWTNIKPTLGERLVFAGRWSLGLMYLTLKSLNFSMKTLETKVFCSIWNQLGLSDSFEYLYYGSTAIRNIFYIYSAGIDISRQNLTSTDVRFWRLMSIPALWELNNWMTGGNTWIFNVFGRREPWSITGIIPHSGSSFSSFKRNCFF